ncbi:hypothetical protein BCY90_26125 [Agrobacterium deltaense]|nr:hypothetical protein BCY90_26125 [Agrobacterium deltaense]
MAERGAQCHLEVGHRGAGVDRPDVRVAIAKLLEDLRAMLDVARQAIDGDAEDDIDALALHMRHEALDAGAELVAGAADGGVGVDLDQLPALTCDKGLAEFDLRFD